MAEGMGLNWSYENDSALRNCNGGYHGVELVCDEMRQALHAAIGGITWECHQVESSVTYRCLSASDPGEHTVFKEHVGTPDGRIHLVHADRIPANERPEADFPQC